MTVRVRNMGTLLLPILQVSTTAERFFNTAKRNAECSCQRLTFFSKNNMTFEYGIHSIWNKRNCERCGVKFKKPILSWFTEQCICCKCRSIEIDLIKKLTNKNMDYLEYEHCGTIPSV